MSTAHQTDVNDRAWSPWIVVWLLQTVPLAFVLLDLPVRLGRGGRAEWSVVLGDLLVLAYAILVAGLGLTGRGRRWLREHRSRLILSLAAVLGGYVLCESAATLLALHGGLGQRRKSLIVYENAGQTLRFDPIRGIRLGSTPSRYARITNGTLEYIGHARGNNEGFPDRDDMHPRRSNPASRRLAVFGDSFTAGQFLQIDWPDRAEDLTRQTPQPLELLNFGVDGGGLANWWSVLTRIVQPQGYQLDGVVFAVFSGDLRRGFSITEYQGYTHPMFARVPSWNPRTFPLTPEQAQTYYDPWEATIVGQKEFEAFLAGTWRPSPPVPFVASLLWQKVLHPAFRRTELSLRGVVDVESERRARIEEIRQALAFLNVPALVVYIPTKNMLIEGAPLESDTRDFAKWIGAECVNGGLAFAGRTAAQIRADWLPYDGHWGQGGSDRFASFMVRTIDQWAASHARTSTGAPRLVGP
ncbi:MAG TPA: hypothetical protein VN853_16970 [Polyangia bacterium]|nr:hypothetical protein [Polyangia bacterium]